MDSRPVAFYPNWIKLTIPMGFGGTAGSILGFMVSPTIFQGLLIGLFATVGVLGLIGKMQFRHHVRQIERRAGMEPGRTRII